MERTANLHFNDGKVLAVPIAGEPGDAWPTIHDLLEDAHSPVHKLADVPEHAPVPLRQRIRSFRFAGEQSSTVANYREDR